MSEKHYDVVVIGAGLFGMATAYHIKKENKNLEILVVDKLAQAGAGNTAQSAAMYRDTFSSEVNLHLSSSTRDFYKHVQHELGIDLSLRDVTYLWLMDKEQFEGNKIAIETMLKNKVHIEILEKEDIKRKIPELVTDFDDNEDAQMLNLRNIDFGLLGYDCGELDADKITRDFYENEFSKLGGETIYNTAITKLILEPIGEKLGIPGEPVGWQKKRIGGALTNTGSTIKSDNFVIATGAWANELLLPLGVDSHTMPVKKYIFRIQHPQLANFLHNEHFNGEKTTPFLIFPIHGIHLKPVKYNNSIWIGGGSLIGKPYIITNPEEITTEDNPLNDTQANDRDYEFDRYLILAEYLPVLKDLQLTNSWAGFYAINTIDKNPVVFKAKGIKGLQVVTSGSGSGIMKADAIGRIAAALYNNQEHAELYGGIKFKVSRLGLENRNVDKEAFVI
ncbi:MAG: NAD(P)/FAD-dependent oxidoreductase [Candidatus Heimdallarchaeaceae archaeon]